MNFLYIKSYEDLLNSLKIVMDPKVSNSPDHASLCCSWGESTHIYVPTSALALLASSAFLAARSLCSLASAFLRPIVLVLVW